MEIKEIKSIPGAVANSLGQIKLPESTHEMPNGGLRAYKTKWVFGCIRRASKTARHSYYGILYRGKNYKIHRLVCEAFHGPAPKGKPIVIHIDENSMNNAPENLKWGTQKENLNMPNFIAYCKTRTGDKSGATIGKRRRLERKED